MGLALLELWDHHDGMKSRRTMTLGRERPAVQVISAELQAASRHVSLDKNRRNTQLCRIIRLNYCFQPLSFGVVRFVAKGTGKVGKGKNNWPHLESLSTLWLEIKKPLKDYQWNSNMQIPEDTLMSNKRKKTFHSRETGLTVNFQIFIKNLLVLRFYDFTRIHTQYFFNRHKRKPPNKQHTVMNGKTAHLERYYYSTK